MRITGLDGVVLLIIGLSVAVMLPVPWLLSSPGEGMMRPDLVRCAPVGLSVDALVLADLGMASRAQTGGCPKPRPLTVRPRHNNNNTPATTATRYNGANFHDSAAPDPTADKVLP